MDRKFFLARISVTNQLFGSRVEALLPDAHAFAECRRGGLVQNLDAATWSTGDFDPIEPWSCFTTSQADAPYLARRERVALDCLIAVQFARGNKLLSAIGTEDVAKVRVTELALEDASLLLFHPTPGLQSDADDQFEVLIWERHCWIGEQELRQAADSLANHFDVSAAECTAEVYPSL